MEEIRELQIDEQEPCEINHIGNGQALVIFSSNGARPDSIMRIQAVHATFSDWLSHGRDLDILRRSAIPPHGIIRVGKSQSLERSGLGALLNDSGSVIVLERFIGISERDIRYVYDILADRILGISAPTISQNEP